VLRASSGAIDGRCVDALPCCAHRPPEPIADMSDAAADIAHTLRAACNACFDTAAV